MDLKALKTFHAIVKHGSFHRAAEALNYAQSTVTTQIRKLEDDLGAVLLDREQQNRLTDEGKVLYDNTIGILQRLDDLRDHLSGMRQGETGHIRLGVTEPAASLRLPALLKRFIDLYPKVQISMSFANASHMLCERLSDGTLDLAVGMAPTPIWNGSIHFEPLFEEELVLLMPENHPLAGKSFVAPRDLDAQRLLGTPDTCPYRKLLESLLQDSGVRYMASMEIASLTALKYYVEQGLGIALLPKIMVDPLPAGLTVRTIGSRPLRMSFGLMYHAYEPFKPAVENMVQYLQMTFGDRADTALERQGNHKDLSLSRHA